ncbi:hypothetical protein N9N55_05175 [Opitutales bacterium]|nr:hypothetical protein [Opitutales bacterium]
MKKVCIYSNVGHFIELYEIQLEIAQRHLDNGDSVEFLFCDGLIPICEINLNKEIDICLHCISRRNQGLKLLKGKYKKRELISCNKIQDIEEIRKIPKRYSELKALLELKIHNFKLGQAVYSSIADIRREDSPNLSEYSSQVRNFIISSSRVYFGMNNYIKRHSPNIVYLFNGRHALEQPVIAACKKNKTTFITHEFAANGGYRLCKNTQPQDFRKRVKILKSILARDITSDEKKLGESFFIKKIGSRQGKVTISKINNKILVNNNSWQKLDDIKKIKSLPLNWNSSKHNVIIFTSSEYEKNVVPYYKHEKLYPNQCTAIEDITNSIYKINSNIHFYIKLHPSYNYWHTNTKEFLSYSKLVLPKNSTLIYPDSELDSYFLIQNCDKVVTFRSTAGVESAFLGKPSISLEHHIISNLQSVYSPKNINDALKLIANTKLDSLSNIDSIKYGLFQITEGVIPKYYQRNPDISYENNWGTFKGKKVSPSRVIELSIKRVLNNKRFTFFRNLIQDHEQKFYYLIYGK